MNNEEHDKLLIRPNKNFSQSETKETSQPNIMILHRYHVMSNSPDREGLGEASTGHDFSRGSWPGPRTCLSVEIIGPTLKSLLGLQFPNISPNNNWTMGFLNYFIAHQSQVHQPFLSKGILVITYIDKTLIFLYVLYMYVLCASR